MALVRISKQLMTDVDTNVSSIKKKTIETLVDPKDPTKKPEYTKQCVELVLALRWEPYAHLRNVIPLDWMTKIGRLDITFKGEIPEFQVVTMSYFPPNTETRYGDYIEIALDPSLAPPGMIAEYDAYKKELGETALKFQTIDRQIKSFLRSCKSLNDALKKYPELSLYVPQHYIDSVNEVRERADRGAKQKDAEVGPEIDKELITSMGVLGSLQK